MTKILLCAVALVALLYSCEKDEYYRINRADWTKLHEGDTLLFNGANRVDTFVVDNINNYIETTDKIYHTEYLRISYERLNQDSVFPENASFYTTQSYQGSVVYWYNMYVSTNSHSAFDTIIQIGENTVKVKYIPSDNQNDSLVNMIRSVYYSNQFGIVKYELNDNTTFQIDSKSLK